MPTKIIGKVETEIKARINWMQEYIDLMIERHGTIPKDVYRALVEKKIALVEKI